MLKSRFSFFSRQIKRCAFYSSLKNFSSNRGLCCRNILFFSIAYISRLLWIKCIHSTRECQFISRSCLKTKYYYDDLCLHFLSQEKGSFYEIISEYYRPGYDRAYHEINCSVSNKRIFLQIVWTVSILSTPEEQANTGGGHLEDLPSQATTSTD